MEAPKNTIRLAAWNPNGIRALFKNNSAEVKRLIVEHNPNIIIFNEIKGNDDHTVAIEKQCNTIMPGFKWYWNNSSLAKGRHGCGVAVHKDLNVISVNYGFEDGVKESEGRIITIELEKCIVVGIYVVNAGMQKCDRLKYKIEWMAKLTNYLDLLRYDELQRTVIVAGDWNVAPEDIDIHNPKTNKNSAGFTKEERDCFRNFLAKGWIDVYRHKHPEEVKYTYWNTVSNARARGVGWRIDHVVINKESIDKIENADCEILDDLVGSDHCPVIINIDV